MPKMSTGFGASSRLDMHLEQLPAPTAALFRRISERCPEIEQFLLVGGTALSLVAQHRLSEDLDFAAAGPKLDRNVIKSIVSKLQSLGSDTRLNTARDARDSAANEGIDLEYYHQDWLIDNVKVTF